MMSAGHTRGADLALLMRRLPLRDTDHVLDVATGAGHTAMAMAGRVARVTGMDAVPEMLLEAARAASELGLINITWVLGDATRLEFADCCFDVVTCRRAAHHITDVPAFLHEVHRVLKPGGYFGLVDHVEAFSPGVWSGMLGSAGFIQCFQQIQTEVCAVEQDGKAGSFPTQRLVAVCARPRRPLR